MKPISKKIKRAIWRGVLVLGLLCEFALIIIAVHSMVQEGETIPHWQSITFMAIAVWIYIAYLKQRSMDISKFAVDEKIKTHLLAQHLSEGVLVLDEDARVLLLNARAAAVTGMPELSALGRAIGALIEPAQADWLAPGRAGDCEGTVRENGVKLRMRVIHLDAEGGVAGHKLVYVNPAAPAVASDTAGDGAWPDDRLAEAADLIDGLAGAAPAGRLRLAGRGLALELRAGLYGAWADDASRILGARQKVAVSEMLAHIVADFKDAAAELGVVLRIEHSDPQLQAYGDRVWLERALAQVCLNAMLCSGKGGEVCVKTAPMGAHAGIAVADAGAIPADTAAAFARPYAGMTGKDGAPIRQAGTGLFLARRVMEKHGGMLSAEPGMHAGMRVTLMLPGG